MRKCDVFFYEGEGPRGTRLDAVRQWIDATNPIVLAGHFNAAKYWDRFPRERFVVFLREPVERMLSEYNYLTRKGVIDMSLREYAESKPGGNKQSRKLGAVRYGDLEPATRAWLEDLNHEDYQIYAQAKALFEARLRG